MRNILIFLVLFSICGSANALTIYLDGYSYHWDRSKGYNEKHNLIGIEYKGWLYVKYLNSHSKKSHAIGRYHEFGSRFGVDFGVKYGLVTGYREVYDLTGDVMPFALLSAGYRSFDLGVGPGMFTAGFRLRFD